MKISKEQYYKDILKALLRGYFVGLKKRRKMCNKSVYNKSDKGIIIFTTKEW